MRSTTEYNTNPLYLMLHAKKIFYLLILQTLTSQLSFLSTELTEAQKK